MELYDIVRRIMKDGAGAFGSDADTRALDARFLASGIPAEEESRRAYRELLFTTPGIEQMVSIAFLPDEAFGQATIDGVLFPDLLASKKILVGLALGTQSEQKISARIQELRSHGLAAVRRRFQFDARAGEGAVHAFQGACSEFVQAMHAIAVVPVVGIVLPDGARTASETEDALIQALSVVADGLTAVPADIRSVIIEASMADAVTAQSNVPPQEVAERTVRALTNALPKDIGGVLVRSFEVAPERATENMNAVARLEPFPFPIAYSYSRAITDPVLALWRGEETNKADAQALFLKRLALLQSADAGGYSSAMEM